MQIKAYVCITTGEVICTKNKIRAWRTFNDWYGAKWREVMALKKYDKKLAKLFIKRREC